MKKLILSAFVALLTFSCSNQEIDDIQSTTNGSTKKSLINETFVADVMPCSGSEFPSYYADAPGNLYSMYSKGYLFFTDNEATDASDVITTIPYGQYYSGGDFIHDMCMDINKNLYCITLQNYLLKVYPSEFNSGDPHHNYLNLSDKFPKNTVFLGLTASHDNTNIFVITAQGDGSGNYWKNYSNQKIYRIAANGNVTEVVSNLQASIIPNNNIVTYTWGSYSYFTYTSILSKSKGAFAYGLSGDGRYYKVGVTSGEVTYYTPRTPIQHLAAATDKTNPMALRERDIVELRPNQSSDIVIGTLPDAIEGRPVLFLSNADATIFYVVVMKDEVNSEPRTYRLKLKN